uniref:Putative Cytochrome c, class II n=1 Tax=Magnetococcus massalia (strain MO-1) TaxID=451514 RepID=A0A1S7LL66_MAGMO|nr:putative Cytochrome c, class II [Candidatus Magnetococcus massalia]
MKKMGKSVVLAAAIMAGVVMSHGVAQAADADATIKHRRGVMTVIGANMGAMGCYMKGQCDYNPKVLAKQAKSLQFAATLSLESFRQNVRGGTVKSTASDKIWSEWDAYARGTQMMQDRAADLVTAVKTGDKKQIGMAMGGLGKTCKGCHDNFRVK